MRRKSASNTLPFKKNMAEFWFNITFHRAEAEDYDDLFSDQEIYEMERNALIDIQNLFGSKVTSKGSVPYLGGTSHTQSIDCVIYPKSLEEIAKIAKIIERNADDIGDDWHIKTKVEYFTANNFRLYPQGLKGKEYYGFNFYNDDGYQYLRSKGKTANLNKSAHWNKISSKKLVKIIEGNGIQLPYFFKDMDLKEAKRITARVGRLLGGMMAPILVREGQIVITGTRVIGVKQPRQPFYAAITSSTGKFIAVDRHFQEEFLKGFEFSDHWDDITMGLHEEAANYPVPPSRFPSPKKLVRRVQFTVRGNDLIITFARQNLH